MPATSDETRLLVSMRANISATKVNVKHEALPYLLDSDDGRGLEALHRFYGPYGPVRSVSVMGSGADMLPSVVGTATYYDVDRLVRRITGLTGLDLGLRNGLRAGGKGFDLPGVITSTLGEAVERLLGALYYFRVEEELVWGSYDDLTQAGYECIDPHQVQFFAESQLAHWSYPFQRFERNTKLRWLPGKRFISGRRVFLPAQLVCLVYPIYEGEGPVVLANSGGMACNVSYPRAVYGGLMEVLERDILNLSWYLRVPPSRLDVNGLTFTRRGTEALNLALERDVTLCLHVWDNHPAYYVVSAFRYRGDRDRLAWAVGTGAGITLEEATTAALREYAQSEVSIQVAHHHPGWEVSAAVGRSDRGKRADFVEIADVAEALIFYGYEENFNRAAPYLADDEAIRAADVCESAPSAPGDLGGLLHALEARGVDPVVVDMGTTSSFSTGEALHVVKVVCPELTQPNVPPYSMLGHRRFQNAWEMAGGSRDEMRFNSLLLPYP